MITAPPTPRLVFLSPTGVLGGAEHCLLDLLATLRADRPAWSLRVMLGEDGPLTAALAALDVPTTLLPIPARLMRLGDAGLSREDRWGRVRSTLRLPRLGSELAGYLARLRHQLAAIGPDLVQTNGMKAHILGTWATPRRVPVVWHLHDYLSARPVMARLLRAAAGTRGGIHAVGVSPSVADDVRGTLGGRVPVQAIENAVDLDTFCPGPGDPAGLDRAAGLPPVVGPAVVRVGLVATYAHWKGHTTFLEAIARVPAELPARFYLVGGPIYRSAGSQRDPNELRAEAEALGVAGRLGFVDHQTEPAAVYRALDVVVHASTRPEPFGRVIVEAMACGRAVVAAPLGGAASLFQDGVSALACPPGNPEQLAQTLTRLVTDLSLRQRLGTGGRAEAVRRFDRRQRLDAWLACYAAAWAGASTRTIWTGARIAAGWMSGGRAGHA